MHKCPACGRLCLCGAVGLCQCHNTPEPDGCLPPTLTFTTTTVASQPINNPLDEPPVDRERDA